MDPNTTIFEQTEVSTIFEQDGFVIIQVDYRIFYGGWPYFIQHRGDKDFKDGPLKTCGQMAASWLNPWDCISDSKTPECWSCGLKIPPTVLTLWKFLCWDEVQQAYETSRNCKVSGRF